MTKRSRHPGRTAPAIAAMLVSAVAGVVVIVASPAEASTAPTLHPKADPVTATSVRATGHVRGAHAGTRVLIQERRTRYDRWVPTTRVRTTRHGDFAFVVPLAKAQRLTYRACAAACTPPQRLSVRRVDPALRALTWPSQTFPIGDLLNPTGDLTAWDYAPITVTGNANPRAAGAAVTLQELVAGQWRSPLYVDYTASTVQPDGSFTLETTMDPLGEQHGQLRVVTEGNDVVRPSSSPVFTTLSWKHFHLAEFSSSGPYLTRSITELWGIRTRDADLVSPQDSTTFNVGRYCSKLDVRAGLLPYGDPSARMTAAIAVDGAPAWSGEYSTPPGAYYANASLSLALTGASTVTLSQAPISGYTTDQLWYDAYVTCAF